MIEIGLPGWVNVCGDGWINDSGYSHIIYIPDNKGQYRYTEATQLLEKPAWNDIPEAQYFLGIAKDKLGLTEQAKKHFQTFLSSPEETVTFLSKDSMRMRAQEYLTQTAK